MRLVMTGLDHTTAGVAVRDLFSPDADARPALLRRMTTGDVAGCVLLVTCNRTELYLSHASDVPPDGAALLCKALGLERRDFTGCFVERSERQAVEHLMRVAAGMRSGVAGDDQIVTQVRLAAEEAREAGTADPLLEALFRSCVAAGKKVRATVSLARDGASAAQRAAMAAADALGTLSGRRTLVIGNGAMGRLVAAECRARGCAVAVAVRDVKRHKPLADGCTPVDFAERYMAMTGCDCVFSATTSSQHTVTAHDFGQVANPPRLLVDLAIPRDIDPAIGDNADTVVLNVDDLHRDNDDDEFRQRIARAEHIVMEEAGRFDLWRRNRRRIKVGQGRPDFPLFVNLEKAIVLVAGGGPVAARRTEKLLSFGARVRLVSPEIAKETQSLLDRDGLTWIRDAYRPEHMDGATLAIAATDNREVNRSVGLDARERGILVSVADARAECTFYFPAIVRSDCLTAGLISNNGDHALVRQSAARLREEMENIDADYQGGKP